MKNQCFATRKYIPPNEFARIISTFPKTDIVIVQNRNSFANLFKNNLFNPWPLPMLRS